MAVFFFFFYSIDTTRIDDPQYHLALYEVMGPVSAGKGLLLNKSAVEEMEEM